MPTASQDKAFALAIQDEVTTETSVLMGALDSAIDWISRNLNPDDVFDEDDLDTWATSNGYKKE